MIFLSEIENGEEDRSGLVNESSLSVFHEDFDDISMIDMGKSTAEIWDNSVILGGTPVPDFTSAKYLDMDWLGDPVHDYSFHPNTMTYDPQSNGLVLSLQGAEEFYLVNKNNGELLEKIDIDTDNNTGIAYYNENYYYSVAGGSSSSQDLFRYDKASKNSFPVGTNSSNKDGFPLVIVDNFMLRGHTYLDGREDWGTMDMLERVSLAEPDDVVDTYPLGFTGIRDLAFDGEYVWVLMNTDDVSFCLLDTQGQMVDSFADVGSFYDLDTNIQARGLAYVGGQLFVLIYEEEADEDMVSGIVKMDLNSKYFEESYLYSNGLFYDGADLDKLTSSVFFDVEVYQPHSTEIKYYVRSGNSGPWEMIVPGEWCALSAPTYKLSYRVELTSTDREVTPRLLDMKIRLNSVDVPGLTSPDGDEWTGTTPEFDWTFNDKDQSDSQSAFEIIISTNESFEVISNEISEVSKNTYYRMEDALENGVTYYWKVRTCDVLRGWSPFSVSAQFKVDNDIPGGGFKINMGNSSCFDVNVLLTIDAYDVSSGVNEIYISNEEVNPSSMPGWEVYSQEKHWTLVDGMGEKTVFMWFRDEVGNVGGPFIETIKLGNYEDPGDDGILGLGKIGAVDTFYIFLGALFLVLLVIILIKRGGDDDYYDDDEDDYDDEDDDDEPEEGMSSLLAIRKKQLKEYKAQEKKELAEGGVKEGFITKDGDASSSSTGGGRYGGGGGGRYAFSSPAGDYSIESTSYSPPSLDDFMNELDSPAKAKATEPVSLQETDTGDTLSKLQQIRDQVNGLEVREKELKDKIEKSKDPNEIGACKKDLALLQTLRVSLEKYLITDGSGEVPPPPPA